MFRQREGTVRRVAAACLLGLALAAPVGCGGSKGTVSGKVAFANGTPVPAGTITFWAADGRQAQATLKHDGTYSLGDAPVGEVKVTVETPPQGMGPQPRSAPPPGMQKGMPAEMIPEGDQSGNVKVIPVPDRYRDKASTPLDYTVTKGTQKKDFTIEP